jgi:hypothetical protein
MTLATPINDHKSLLFPWNKQGAARAHVLAFLALAESLASRTAPDPRTAPATLAWLRMLTDIRRDDERLP